MDIDYPVLFKHLQEINFSSNGKVENRSDKGKHWTNLRSCAFLEEFEKEKIVWGLITGNWNFALDKNGNYLSSASYFLTSEKFSLEFILALLNSKLYKFYFENIGEQTAGGAYVLKKTSVEKFILPNVSKEIQLPLIQKVKIINNWNQEFIPISQKFSIYFSQHYKLEKRSAKLEKWYKLDFPDFINELNKAIKGEKGTPLTKKDEFEWMELFEENKKQALELKSQIDQTDKEIDRMVYELYGLTEEEIQIVENS